MTPSLSFLVSKNIAVKPSYVLELPSTKPLADALCVGIDALASQSGPKTMIFLTDGAENSSSGPCSGPDSVLATPPYDPGSWHQIVRDAALAASIQVDVDFYGSTVESLFDVETGETRGNRAVIDETFFSELAQVTGGAITLITDDDLAAAVPTLGGYGLTVLIILIAALAIVAKRRR